jgi:signal peptidase II
LYGILFDKGSVYDAQYEDYVPYADMAQMNGEGYAPALMGNVVDMIHVTKWIHFPEWFPVWGGEMRPLFPPIFNIADAAISVGIIFLLLFQKRFFKQQEEVVTVIESSDSEA